MMSYSFVIFVINVIPAVVDLYVMKFITYQNDCLSNLTDVPTVKYLATF